MTDIIAALPNLLNGLLLTCVLLCAAVLMGLMLATLMTMATYSNRFLLKKSVEIIGFFFRGTPLLIQFFIIYYGAAQFEWVRSSFLWPLLSHPMSCAIIALALNSASYTTVLLNGAIRSIPQNEITACAALGMSKWLAFYRIIFSRAFKIALPSYSNEVIMLLKGTSLASTITLLELMGVTQQWIANTYDTFTFYILAGVLYLVLTGAIYGVFKLLHRYGFG